MLYLNRVMLLMIKAYQLSVQSSPEIVSFNCNSAVTLPTKKEGLNDTETHLSNDLNLYSKRGHRRLKFQLTPSG